MKIKYILFLFWAFLLTACSQVHQPDGTISRAPKIFPDYTAVTLPPNIAPVNFEIQEKGDAFQTEIGWGNEVAIVVTGDEPTVDIPESDWHDLLEKAKGKTIFFRISVLQNGKWMRYADIHDTISTAPIDPVLVYRLLYPGYELWNEMGIYQRDLTSFEQTPIVENRNFGKMCVNCHNFADHNPDTMMLHVRGKLGGTMIVNGDQVKKVTPNPASFAHGATYPSWRPGGRYIAYSTNEVQQFFHSAGKKPIEVSDLAADLMVYDTQTNTAFTDSLVYGDQYLETFPHWAPDGKTLYFCRCSHFRKGMALDSIRYSLYRVQVDVTHHRISHLECVYDAEAKGKSVSFPRVSPDGKYLLFTQSNYGNFSIWHAESDLYLLDIATGKVRRLNEVNSKDVDSYHCWSTNGRWFVFSSKRLDGLWARPFFASFDPKTGKAGKPFLLPQKDPHFYDRFTLTFNVPELIKGKVRKGRKIEHEINAQNAVQATEAQ
ncbi:MAG: cytochrome C biosynthesis protein [Prevotella sp.]|jgi:hypothetical protein|nr:cytochrome C biosynthesis protein [Prevotella sp.]MCI2080174.1 cytochrome C biosynthesis protein [Prevotella sp.]MCI2102077.1 cytochrome C biosynthesis protein [Prevotella sp.]